MDFQQFVEDDEAVPPVIGVILMIAITVILAAVIGTFVLGHSDDMQTTAPTDQFDFDQGTNGGNNEVDITHNGGDSIDGDRLTVTIDGTDAITSEQFSNSYSDVSAGNSVTITDDGAGNTLSSGDTIRVVWESEDGGNSQVIADYEVN